MADMHGLMSCRALISSENWQRTGAGSTRRNVVIVVFYIIVIVLMVVVSIVSIVMEKATLDCGPDGQLMLHPVSGASRAVTVPPGSGYAHELRHFLHCLKTGKTSPVVTPESAWRSLKLVEAEIRSARAGRRVILP